jgi:hypothetical protein
VTVSIPGVIVDRSGARHAKAFVPWGGFLKYRE